MKLRNLAVTPRHRGGAGRLHAGCPGGRGRPGDRPGAPWFDALRADIDQARAADATPEQVEVLLTAFRTGVLTFEACGAAVDRALRCVREVGFRVLDDRTTTYQGLPVRLYSMPSGRTSRSLGGLT